MIHVITCAGCVCVCVYEPVVQPPPSLTLERFIIHDICTTNQQQSDN